MAKRLYFDQAAEREANEIAFRFMDNSDVVGDMSRAYGADLSSVRIHTDENAAQKVEGTGADAFSTGKDVFFGRGVFDRNDPASRGLLAHELAHSLQQGVGGGAEGGVEQSAPEGAAQGGLIDWFRRLFSKKPKTPQNVKKRIPEARPRSAAALDLPGVQQEMQQFTQTEDEEMTEPEEDDIRKNGLRAMIYHSKSPAFESGKKLFHGFGSNTAEYVKRLAGGGVNVGSIGQNLEEMGPLPSEKTVQYSEPLGQMSSDLLQMVGSYAASDAGRDYVQTIVDPIKRFKAFGDDPTGAANTQNARNFVMEKLIGIARAEAESGMQRAYAPDKRGAARSRGKGVDYRSANASVVPPSVCCSGCQS